MTHGDMTKVTCGLTNTLRPVPANSTMTVAIRWDEKAGLRRDAVRSQVIDVL